MMASDIRAKASFRIFLEQAKESVNGRLFGDGALL
jgi:hypothetical protein